jgi:hypothetical protein
MRVMLRSGAMLLVMGAFMAGCSDSATTPNKVPGPPAKTPSATSSSDTTNSDASASAAAETDYVVTVSGMA